MGKVRGGGVLHERPVIDVVEGEHVELINDGVGGWQGGGWHLLQRPVVDVVEGEHVVLEDLAQKLPAIIVVGRLVKL